MKAKQTSTDSSSPPTLLKPGHNCWRVEAAKRLQFLIDGENYFSHLRATLRRAQRSIFIIGWDIDSRVKLPRGDDDEMPEALAPFLDELAHAQRDLQIYVLSWDYAVLFALEREWLPTLNLQWRTHRRVHFYLDDQHPRGASHHQKLVVVDDCVAFVGGFDITRCRWDTSAHAPENPSRCDADGVGYSPFHDVQIIVEGSVAHALGELARDRWRRATGWHAVAARARKSARSPVSAEESSPWPPNLSAALTNVVVGIARTQAPFENHHGYFEIRNFYLDAIGAARDHIFIENQYFSSRIIAQALSARMQEMNPPEIIVVAPRYESGWLEQSTMGLLRARIYAQLHTRGDAEHFHPYYPRLADGGWLNVHSKLMTIDDNWLTLGSANISNRSMSLDTECNLILEAGAHGERANEVSAAIAMLRNRLLAEHLDSDIETIAEKEAHYPLVEVIEMLRSHNDSDGRNLHPADCDVVESNSFANNTLLIDPEEPLVPERVIAEYVSPHEHHPLLRRATYVSIFAIICAALVLLWRETPLKDFVHISTVLDFVGQLKQQPFALVWILALYVIGGLVFVPVILLIAATGMVFGPWLGLLYALSGSLLSAAVMYWIGAKTGSGLWKRMFNRRFRGLQLRLRQQGLLAVAMVRAMPVAPYSVVNLIAGAAHIAWRDFMLGTLIGMSPGIALTVLFVDSATAALRQPSLGSVTMLVLEMGFIVAVSLLLQYWLRHKKNTGDMTPSATNGE